MTNVVKMMNIKWKTVFIGVVLAVTLNFIFLAALGLIFEIFSPVTSIMAFLLSSIYIGYLVGNYKNVWAYGILVGVIGYIFVWLLTLIILLLGYGIGEPIDLINNLITGVILFGLTGSIGASIGIYIKRIRTSTLSPNKIIKNHPKTFSALLIFGIIFLTLFVRINQYVPAFSYEIANISLLIFLIIVIIAIIWYLIKNGSNVSINTFKREFVNNKKEIMDFNSLPDKYRNVVIIGYISLILFVSNITFIRLIGFINGSLISHMLVILSLLAFISLLYFLFKINIKENVKDPVIRKHIMIILFSICLITLVFKP